MVVNCIDRGNEDKNHVGEGFFLSERPHILMITNHGTHLWELQPGLVDTGGQNVYVNDFAQMLVENGFKVTIANRGGYYIPSLSCFLKGLRYKGKYQRILYLEDGIKRFIRKEHMDPQTQELAIFLRAFFDQEGSFPDLIISHYWDSAVVGYLFTRNLQQKINHIWVPHSLGLIKAGNISPEMIKHLCIKERISIEKEILKRIDGVVATSYHLAHSLKVDYGCRQSLFLPPCINTNRFFPRSVPASHEIWSFLTAHSTADAERLRNSIIISEFGRTDYTKRKDILIKAFAKVVEINHDIFLLMIIDNNETNIAQELLCLINKLKIESNIIIIDQQWERMPILYSITDIYCSPSVMEGFGMAVQEAAATEKPIIGSTLIPFLNEYLLGEKPEKIKYDIDNNKSVMFGSGAIAVEPNDISGFAYSLRILIENRELQKKMAERAYRATIPDFTWRNNVLKFLQKLDEDGILVSSMIKNNLLENTNKEKIIN